MFKTFKKSIALVLALVFMMSLVPLGAIAEIAEGNGVSADVEFINWAWARNNNNTGNSFYQYTGSEMYAVQLCGAGGSNERRAYAQLDLTGYEEILANEDTKVEVTFKSLSVSNSYNLKNIDVYAMDDSTDTYPEVYYSSAEPMFEGDPQIRMSYANAGKMGLHNYDEKGILLASRSDAGSQYWTFEADASALSQQLQTGTDNSRVSLTIEGTNTSGTSYVHINAAGDKRTKAVITYDKSKIDNQEYVDSIADAYEWSEVSEQDIDEIKTNLVLPEKYRGATVTWSSDDTSVIENDGTVHFAKGPKSATLTATLTYKGIDESAPEATATKDFVVTVTSESAQEVLIPFTNYGNARSDKPANKNGFSTNSTHTNIHYISASGSWYGYAQLDLSGYEEILKNPGTKATFNIVAGNGFTSYAFNFKAYLASDSTDGYKYNEVSYNDIKALGIIDENRPVLFEDNDDVRASNGTLISGDANLENLVAVLDESATNGLVTIWFAGENGEVNGATKATNFRINDASCGLKIKYFASETDDAAYAEELESGITWEKVSKDSADAVENNLSTYYAGANITWSSDKGVVKEDGTIVPPMGKNANATLTATVDYNGNTFEKDFAVTLVAAKAVTVHVPFASFGNWRSDKPSQLGNTSYNSDKKMYINTGGDWVAHAKFDLSAYEEILRNPHTSVGVNLTPGNGYSSGMCNDFKIIAIPDSFDAYNARQLSYTEAKKLGWLDTEGRSVLFARSDATELKGVGHTVSGEANKKVLVDALNESYFNGNVSLIIVAGESGKQSQFYMQSANNYLTISYYPVETDDEGFMEEIEADSSWDNLTADSAGSVINSFPTYFRGSTICWSSDEGLVNSDGTLNRSREEALSGTIKASFTYKDYSFEKEFDVTLAQVMPKVIRVKSTSNDVCQVGVRYQNDYFEHSSYTFYPTSGSMYVVPESGRGDVHAFVRIDLSDYVKYIEAATDISFTLVNRNSASFDRAMVTVLNDGCDDWLFGDSSGLTYNKAISSGMYTDPGYGVFYGVHIPNKNTSPKPVVSDELTQAIKNAVGVNPDEGLVTFRVSSANWEGVSFQLSGSAGFPYVDITYYEEDVMTDEELAQAKKDKLLWSRITKQDIDNVVADLELPEKWYGKDVIWASSDDSVISSSGEVTVAAEAKTVTLTATIDGGVNEFNVTVPASKIAVKSEYSHKKSGTKASGYTDGSNLNYTGAHIYANEDIEGTFDVVIATYKNGTLYDVTMSDDVTITKGHVCIPSGHHYAFGSNVETKVMVFDEMGVLKPLVEAR